MSGKNLNAEVDLVAFISLLSALICSLLLTAVWVHIGTMDVKQAMGGQPATDAKPEPTMYVKIDTKGNLRLSLKDAPKKANKLRQRVLQGVNSEYDVESFATYVNSVKQALPNFNIALIEPNKDVLYEKIISLMDDLRRHEVKDLGIVPL